MKKVFFKDPINRLDEGEDSIRSNNERVTKISPKKFQKRNSIKIEKFRTITDEKIQKDLSAVEKYEGKNRNNQLTLQKSKPINPKFIFGIIYFMIISKINLIFIDNRILNNDSSITIKIQKSGLSKLYYREAANNFCGNGPDLPIEIIINNNEEEHFALPNEHNFPNEGNTVKLIYADSITSCRCLFYNCENITEIDLTSFDTSNVNEMQSMFHNCFSLTSIIFSDNFKTSNVESMAYMFCGCFNLKELDLSNFVTTNVTNMRIMFGSCHSLTSINIYFDTTNVVDMGYLFFDCISLKYLDLSPIYTPSLVNMDCMFQLCTSLTSLKLSWFETENVRNMSFMFWDCKNLTDLDLSSFNTAQVTEMQYMFAGCSSLTTIILSNFNTGNVVNMRNMFGGCSSLTSLDLNNFKTERVNDIAYMFYGCSKLTYINLKSFNTNNVVPMDRMFAWCSSLSEIDITNFNTHQVTWMADMFLGCSSLKTLDLSNFDTSSVTNMAGMFRYCYSLSSLNLEKFFIPNAQYIDGMFDCCHSLTSFDISKFNTHNVKSMRAMFASCLSLTELDLSHFNTQQVEDMAWMFHNCQNLTSINLNNFVTTNLKYMEYMFQNCLKLKSLEISHFTTSNVVTMTNLFCWCPSLTSVDVSHFDTSQVTDMCAMFARCESLKEINVINFNTQQVLNMSNMFEFCLSLESLDVSNFNTKEVVNMEVMFSHCEKLKSLNLNNFDTSKVTNMRIMFCGCYNIETLNIINFKTELVENMEWMFYECYKLKSLEISNFNTKNVKSMAAMFVRCSTVTSIDLTKFDTSLVTNALHMFEDCQNVISLDLSNFITTNIENIHAMFLRCRKLSSLSLSNFYLSKATDLEWMFAGCSNLKYIDLKNAIINENIKKYHIIDETLINPIICIDDSTTFYKVISEYDCSYNLNCSDSWGEKIVNIKEEENVCFNGCLLSKYNSEQKCYQICSYYFYFDENNNKYICTDKFECPESYNKLIHEKNECVKSCQETKENQYEFNNKCLKCCPENFVPVKERANFCTPKCPKESPFLFLDSLKCTSSCTIKERQNNLCITNYITTKDDDFNIFDVVLEQVRYEIENNFDETVVNGNPIKENGLSIIITRTKDNDINLGECEEKLKEHYNISEDESLYLLRIDVEQVGMRVGSFEYEVMYPIEDNNLKKLNLTICKDVKIDISVPMNITGDLEKYNSSSPYYNDICYISDSDEGKDISLNDRKQEYINNNMSVCEQGCDFVSYNYELQKAVCSCGIKTEIPFMDNVKVDKDLLMDSFTDINNIANTKLMTCYKTIFKKKFILKNYGCFIFGVLIILNLICFFLFLFKYYKILIKQIEKLKITILNINKNKLNINNNINKRKKSCKNVRKNNLISNEISNAKKSGQDKTKLFANKKPNRRNKKKVNHHSPPKLKKLIKINNINNGVKKSFRDENINNIEDLNSKSKTILSKNNKRKKLRKSLFKKLITIKLNNSELNSLQFQAALIKDKRSYVEYYLSLIKINHILFFIFYKYDFNSKIIKVSIFLFNLASYIAVNALFFNDSTMHKIFTDGGSYNFVYQLPQIIYSTIISAILNAAIKLLGLTERNILSFKKAKAINIDKRQKNLIIILKIKFIFFYVTLFAFLGLFWYYVTCFCGIYRNTQMHLIKDSLVSFSTSLITPFVIYLVPGFVRIYALKKKNKILYGLSKVLQSI